MLRMRRTTLLLDPILMIGLAVGYWVFLCTPVASDLRTGYAFWVIGGLLTCVVALRVWMSRHYLGRVRARLAQLESDDGKSS